MGYTKTWTPPTIPYRDNLAAWKTICQDIHDHMILAGLVQTDDTGQLADINAVSVLPADGSFAGYRVYRFNDALSATCPIVIKLSFGCGVEGNTATSTYCRSRTIRMGVHIGKTTDGGGTIDAVSTNTYYECPQSLDNSASVTSQLTQPGLSMICYNEEAGFFGFLYGTNSRNIPPASDRGAYSGATLSILIQRNIDANGAPTDDGFCYFQQYESGSWASDGWNTRSFSNPAAMVFINKTGTVSYEDYTCAMRPGGTFTTPIDSVAQTHPVYMLTPEIKRLQTLVTYRDVDLVRGTEFQLEIAPGKIWNYITLGNENRLSVSANDGHNACFAMLYQ